MIHSLISAIPPIKQMLRHANKLIITVKLVHMTLLILYALQSLTDIQDVLYQDWINMLVLE